MLLYTFRGIANKHLTCENVLKIATIEGAELRAVGCEQILLAGDHRLSTTMLKYSLTAGFLSIGLDVIDCGILPTPILSATVKRLCLPGAMVTASHNPPEWNGLQFHEPDSHVYGPEKEELIKSMLNSVIALPDWSMIGRLSFNDSYIDQYTSQLIARIDIGKRVKVIADFGGGVASLIIPELFRNMEIDFIEINSELDPLFSKRPSEPSPEVLTELRSRVVEEKADVGFAYDGDADRVMVVDENGDVVNGDEIIFLLANELMPSLGPLVLTADISMVVEKALKERGFKIILDRWGQTFIGDTIRKNGAIFGAETNDHYIFPEFSLHADAIAASAFICSILSQSNKRLSCMFDEIPKTYILREKLPFTEDLEYYSGRIEPFLKEKYGGYNLIHSRLYLTNTNGNKLLIRQSPFDNYVRVFAESFYPHIVYQMINGVKEILGIK